MAAIQGAISNLATLTASAMAVNKKLKLDQSQQAQALEQQQAKLKAAEKAEKQAKKAKKDEAIQIAQEVDLQRLGVSPKDARAFSMASKLGGGKVGAGQLHDLKGNVVATYSEAAEILADKSLKDTLTSQAKTSSRYRERLMSLGHSYDERVKNALMASGEK